MQNKVAMKETIATESTYRDNRVGHKKRVVTDCLVLALAREGDHVQHVFCHLDALQTLAVYHLPFPPETIWARLTKKEF